MKGGWEQLPWGREGFCLYLEDSIGFYNQPGQEGIPNSKYGLPPSSLSIHLAARHTLHFITSLTSRRPQFSFHRRNRFAAVSLWESSGHKQSEHRPQEKSFSKLLPRQCNEITETMKNLSSIGVWCKTKPLKSLNEGMAGNQRERVKPCGKKGGGERRNEHIN